MKKKIDDKTNNIDINTGFGWLGKAIQMLDVHGFWKIIKAIFVVILLAIVTTFLVKPEIVFDRINLMLNNKHNELIEKRMTITPELRLKLKELRLNIGASRTYIFELSNGSSNSAGLPFVYSSMKYEDSDDSTESVDADYQQLALSRFCLFDEIYNEGVWVGDSTKIMATDRKLAPRIFSSGTKYIIFVTLYGGRSPLGFLGASFITPLKQREENQTIHTLRKYAGEIGALLSETNT